LEWQTERVSYREDALGRARSLVIALEDGLKQFSEEEYGRRGPAEEVK
jgi:hypothetical protein